MSLHTALYSLHWSSAPALECMQCIKQHFHCERKYTWNTTANNYGKNSIFHCHFVVLNITWQLPRSVNLKKRQIRSETISSLYKKILGHFLSWPIDFTRGLRWRWDMEFFPTSTTNFQKLHAIGKKCVNYLFSHSVDNKLWNILPLPKYKCFCDPPPPLQCWHTTIARRPSTQHWTGGGGLGVGLFRLH